MRFIGMSRFFEVAYKVENGTKVKDANGDYVKWDVKEEHMPEYGTKNAAGADFCAVEDVTIPSLWKSFLKFEECKLALKEQDIRKLFIPTIIHTGIKARMEDDEVLTIYNRSSGPKKLGLIMANSAGIIDADYYGCDGTDGEIMFAYYNIFPFDVEIHKGDKIGQGIFSKVLRADNSNIGGKRVGGFGSTSKN